MAGGEFISVSNQRDTKRAALAATKEERQLDAVFDWGSMPITVLAQGARHGGNGGLNAVARSRQVCIVDSRRLCDCRPQWGPDPCPWTR